MLVLAELLPGTPIAELLAMRVDRGVAILRAGSALARFRRAHAAGDTGGGHVATAGPATRTIRGGLDVLSGFMRRG